LKPDAYRRSQTSVVLQDQKLYDTGFSGGRQVLIENLALDLTVVMKIRLHSTGGGLQPRANDNYLFANSRWIGISGAVDSGRVLPDRNDDSSDTNHSFYNHQGGLNVVTAFEVFSFPP